MAASRGGRASKRGGSSLLRLTVAIILVLIMGSMHYTHFLFGAHLMEHIESPSRDHDTKVRGAVPGVASTLGSQYPTSIPASPSDAVVVLNTKFYTAQSPPTSPHLEFVPSDNSKVPITTKKPAGVSEVKKTLGHSAVDETSSLDETYYVVFSTGCSEFQDWQSIGVYSSAERVGQRGIITRIASGCTSLQEVAIRHAMSHLPNRCRVHFAPNTQVRDHSGSMYKYANKPLGMMHWLNHAEPPVPPASTIALIDPDMFFIRPLWHDSFDAPSKVIVTGSVKVKNVPKRIVKGTMIAQQYGIGSAPWSNGPGRKAKAWALDEYFSKIAGRPFSPALASDLTQASAGTWYSIGAPYIALASDWLPISTNWTNLMPMAVERNFGNLAEMYAMVIAVADLGIRPARIDNMMVSNVGAGGEGWPWVDNLPMDKGCDPAILQDPQYPLPTFLHYCQRYEIAQLKNAATAAGLGGQGQHGNSDVGDLRGAHWMFTKYQVPDEILQCPAGSQASEGVKSIGGNKASASKMKLGPDGLLPEPPIHIKATSKSELRSVFSHCLATRATNQAAKDYRKWFCNAKH
eukprot:CAMPEP_0171688796 /NCGR_PEP_ID=MMETSP0991-20121206/4101_1 /TAXON_ID=483369 /ORGANISM="non described non described, Strain CCMP2098" /LENGTH=573 /DNA_ID=CAMNT_0012276791 /DNA_START=28 /DNA_END=1749 /DNA_ORIENTATION=+